MSVIESLQNNGFATIDYIIFAAYIVLLVSLGLFLSRNKKGKEKSSTDYFLAGNTLTWWAVGASLIAANISAEQFIGMSGSAFYSGIAQAAYELMAAATLLVVGKFLLPLMIEKKIFTIPQFLRERYNWGVGFAFSLLWLFLYVFVNLTSVAWLGALAIQQILGLPTDLTVHFAGMDIDQVRLVIILCLFIIAGAYSIYGGLASVAWTDVLQVVFLVGGGLVTAYAALTVIGAEVWNCGPIEAIQHIYSWCINQEGDKHFNLVVTRNEELYPVINGVKDATGAVIQKSDPFFDSPGIVLIFGALWLTNIGYWGFNQYIIQKGLAAKSLSEAKKGMVFAAFLKILIPFIVCIPGVCAFFIMNSPECEGLRSTLFGSITRSDDAYPFLIRNFTPVVVKGLSFAALAAAVISSLASMFNSTSTLFTMDIYKQFINKKASERKLVKVGRMTAVCALIIALIAVYPLMGGIDQAFQFIQEYSAFVYPGVVVIFGLGLLWKRASGKAAVAAAIGTFVFSIIFKFAFPEIPFLIRSGYVFIVLLVMFVTITYCDKSAIKTELPIAEDCKRMMKWGTITGVAAIICFIAALVQKILYLSGSTNEVIVYLENLGFEALFFTTALLVSISILLISNSKDTIKDPRALDIDLNLFKTDKSFAIGSFGVIAILAILYIAFW